MKSFFWTINQSNTVMKRLLSLTTILLFTISISDIKAQEAITISDTLSGWDQTWKVNLNGSQAAYSNWSRGGTNNISGTGATTFTTVYREGQFAYGFLINARYGKSKIQNEGVRKTSDRLAIRNRFLYDFERETSDLALFANINFNTQFDQGFNYGAGPDGEDILISNFMAPGYFSQNAGLAYVPNDYFSAEVGLGLKQTIVRNTDLSERYGLPAGDNFRSEAGFTLGFNFSKDIFENVGFSSTLETFTNLNKAVSSTDVYLSSQLLGRINSFMNASLQFDLIYDDDFSKEVQLSQILSLGVSFTLF
jgi:hypothetical protein